MKKIILIMIVVLAGLIFSSCGTLLTYKYSFPKDIYNYDKLYATVLLDMNMRGIRILNTEKAVGLIHTETEEILLTQTDTDTIYSRTTKFMAGAYAKGGIDDEWQRLNNVITDNISKMYFQNNR